MTIIGDLFGKSPFGPLVEHARKVHEAVEMLNPLMEALAHENYLEIHRLQDKISKMEYEADQLKHEIREHLPRRFLLPVDKALLDKYLRCQDAIADQVEDFAIILLIRETRLHTSLIDQFFQLVSQVFQVTGSLLAAAIEFQNLAEVSFSGVEARKVLDMIGNLGEEEWKADRLARKLSIAIYKLEKELDPVTISFYEKMLLKLGGIANEAENAGDIMRLMIVKS